MKELLNKLIFLFLISIAFLSCELVDTPIEPDDPIPTRNIRYVVGMTSSSNNSSPVINYTNNIGGTTELRASSLDLTVAIDSGSVINLSASCSGFYSPITRNAFASVDIKIFLADSLLADSLNSQSSTFGNVNASATLTIQVD
jgi:hypothetical protein